MKLNETELRACFALMGVAGFLKHMDEQQLRRAATLTYVQPEVVARLDLDSPTGSLRLTQRADEVVHSCSRLTYQAGQVPLDDLQPAMRSRTGHYGQTRASPVGVGFRPATSHPRFLCTSTTDRRSSVLAGYS